MNIRERIGAARWKWALEHGNAKPTQLHLGEDAWEELREEAGFLSDPSDTARLWWEGLQIVIITGGLLPRLL